MLDILQWLFVSNGLGWRAGLFDLLRLSLTPIILDYNRLTTTYGIIILEAAGVANPFRWSIITAILALIGTITGGILNDYVGRRPLTLIALSLVAVFDYIAGGIGFTGIKTTSQGTALAGVSIILAFMCQLAFSG